MGGGPGGLCGSEGKGLGLGADLSITSGLAGKASSVGGEGRGFGASVEAVSGLAGNASWEGTGAGVESAGGSSGASWSAQGFSSLSQGWYKKFSALAGSRSGTKGGSSVQGSGRS